MQLQAAEHDAYYDQLTGLFNRRGWQVAAERACGESGRLPSTVIFLILKN